MTKTTVAMQLLLLAVIVSVGVSSARAQLPDVDIPNEIPDLPDPSGYLTDLINECTKDCANKDIPMGNCSAVPAFFADNLECMHATSCRLTLMSQSECVTAMYPVCDDNSIRETVCKTIANSSFVHTGEGALTSLVNSARDTLCIDECLSDVPNPTCDDAEYMVRNNSACMKDKCDSTFASMDECDLVMMGICGNKTIRTKLCSSLMSAGFVHNGTGSTKGLRDCVFDINECGGALREGDSMMQCGELAATLNRGDHKEPACQLRGCRMESSPLPPPSRRSRRRARALDVDPLGPSGPGEITFDPVPVVCTEVDDSPTKVASSVLDDALKQMCDHDYTHNQFCDALTDLNFQDDLNRCINHVNNCTGSASVDFTLSGLSSCVELSEGPAFQCLTRDTMCVDVFDFICGGGPIMERIDFECGDGKVAFTRMCDAILNTTGGAQATPPPAPRYSKITFELDMITTTITAETKTHIQDTFARVLGVAFTDIQKLNFAALRRTRRGQTAGAFYVGLESAIAERRIMDDLAASNSELRSSIPSLVDSSLVVLPIDDIQWGNVVGGSTPPPNTIDNSGVGGEDNGGNGRRTFIIVIVVIGVVVAIVAIVVVMRSRRNASAADAATGRQRVPELPRYAVKDPAPGPDDMEMA